MELHNVGWGDGHSPLKVQPTFGKLYVCAIVPAMQSTKEETFLSSNRLETAPTTWHGSYSSASSKTLMLSSSLTTAIEEEPFHSNMKSAEAELTWGVVANKLSVVFLVAMGTICFLTNTLVLLLLCRQRGALCFRYRLVRSQAVAGIITSTVVIYPLKVSRH